MTILVTGSSGQLGKTFRDHLGTENTFYLDRKKCDLSDKKSLKDCLDKLKPSRIINCAAYTNVDKAETEKDLAFEVNGHAVGIISEWVKKHDSEIIHFSTDYVFDGDQSTPYSEGDKPNPLSTYGKSKLLGEQLFLDSGARGVCLRTSWVHSNYGQNFYLTMRKLISERREIKVVRDQFGVPTTCDFIVKKTLKLIEKNVNKDLDNKIIHCVPSGSVCWYEFAVKIMENLLSNKQIIECKSIIPVPSIEFAQKAIRPKNSTLENSLLKSILRCSVEDWSESHSKLYALN